MRSSRSSTSGPRGGGSCAGADALLARTTLEIVGSNLHMLCSSLQQQPIGVPGDHQIFIGRHHPNGGGAVITGNDRCVGAVAALVELDAKEVHVRTDACANRRGVL